MKGYILALFALLANCSLAFAQSSFLGDLSGYKPQVTALSGSSSQLEAVYGVFGKTGPSVDPNDIKKQLEDGAHLYITSGSAILVTKEKETIFLVPSEDGRIEVVMICRILPICPKGSEPVGLK
ncbi:hypothetical protein ABCW43_01885 [Neorhizobium sp. IRAMC:178]|uniref:hypothetical protein n=1 Tax=Neorhizobium tunisiense TaxID=3144793 RepID=UPI0031F61EF0